MTPLFYIGSIRGNTCFLTVDMTEYVVELVAQKHLVRAGPGGMSFIVVATEMWGPQVKTLYWCGMFFWNVWPIKNLHRTPVSSLFLAAWLYWISYLAFVWWTSGKSGANFSLCACWRSQDLRLPMHARMNIYARDWKRQLMGQYTGFNIFRTLTLPSKIGDFYLLTQRTSLMILI